MKTKLEYAKINIIKNIENIQCPLCCASILLIENSLVCENKHTFNINKKGVVSFSTPLNDKLYGKEMFEARNIVLNSGIYDEVFYEINNLINSSDELILDLGAGEGTYLSKLDHDSNNLIGIDLAKDGLNIASNNTNINWFLADLAKLPIKSNSVRYILNILSPANYEEFKRVLKQDGFLIKVIVNSDYLIELRDSTKHDKHDNTNVVEILKKNFDIISSTDIKYSKSLSKDLAKAVFKMTPLTSNHEYNADFNEITIDLKLILARKRG